MNASKILVIDNYDSFTYNLVHVIEKIVGHEIDVVRNDKTSFEEVDAYDILILSPGPGIPDEAGMLKEIIKEFAQKKKILGVCLGQQAIGEVFGASLTNMEKVFHGVATEMQKTEIQHDLFNGLESTFEAGRYHSWVINKDTNPEELLITCIDSEGEIMAVKHREYNVHAVQFHPESVLTPQGERMIENFIKLC